MMLKATFFLAFGFATQVYACKCDGSGSIKTSFTSAEGVVYGKVISKTLVPFTSTLRADKIEEIKIALKDNEQKLALLEMLIVKVELALVEKYKGVSYSDTISFYTTMNGASCGYKFEVGQSYIVYFSKSNLNFLFDSGSGGDIRKEKIYWTNNCTRTSLFSKTEAAELRALKGQ